MKFFLKKPIHFKTIVFAIVLIIIIIVGVFGYREVNIFLAKREKVVAVLNKNTEVYNSTTDPSKQLLISLKALLDFTNTDDVKIQENVAELEKKIPEIRELSVNIEKSGNELHKGDIPDTQNIYTTFNEVLATKKATIDVLGNFIEYEVCLIKNASLQYKNISEFSDNLTKFSQSDEKTSPQEKAVFVDTANKKINENIELTNKVVDCFKDERFSKYLTNEMKLDISKDVDLYNQYANATKVINDGLIKSSSQLLQDGTTQLLSLKDKNPIFYNSDGFKSAIQEPKKLLQDQATILETQESRIKNQTVALKTKYFLD